MGLAGKPSGSDGFVRFEAEGTAIYLARDIWDAASAGVLQVLLPGFGSFAFRFDAAG